MATLLAGRGDAPLALCAYDDGPGHPIAFGRSMFGALTALHGDKGVWRLLDERAADVVRVPVAGPIPLDVDTEEDYRAVLRGHGMSDRDRRGRRAGPRRRDAGPAHGGPWTTWSTRAWPPRSS